MKTRLNYWRLVVLSMAVLPIVLAAGVPPRGDTALAARAVNALGLELLGAPADANALLSPYSVQSAMMMTFAGAAGDTRSEMARVLHYTNDEPQMHLSFATLQNTLDDLAKRMSRTQGVEPVALMSANRLFGQTGHELRTSFLDFVKNTYGAPVDLLDFAGDPGKAAGQINQWVAEQTSQRIRDLIPPGDLTKDTRLVLVNAVYLKAPWSQPFGAEATRPLAFRVRGGKAEYVPTMFHQGHYGYAHRDGFSVVVLPYRGGELQFLILLPDDVNGLAALEKKLTPELLAGSASPGTTELMLSLPKFKLEPPLMKLGDGLRALGMNSAFDRPRGSANFDRMSPRKPDDYLYISEVFHKTFLALDEKGTEAAAASAVGMFRATSVQVEKPKPVEVHVDHPFLFAIQHRASGACLFLGRMTDPR